MSPHPPTLRNSPAQPIQRRAMLAWLGLWTGLPAMAQRPFALQPEPHRTARLMPSMARNEQDCRKDAARHLYAMYPAQVLKGMVRANVYAIMVTATTVDANGKLLSLHVLRKPAVAHEVSP